MNEPQRAQTIPQSARVAARRDRVRAFVRVAASHYDVYSSGRKYVVWYNEQSTYWECNCASRPDKGRPYKTCKHCARVMDREAKRLKKEASDG